MVTYILGLLLISSQDYQYWSIDTKSEISRRIRMNRPISYYIHVFLGSSSIRDVTVYKLLWNMRPRGGARSSHPTGSYYNDSNLRGRPRASNTHNR